MEEFCFMGLELDQGSQETVRRLKNLCIEGKKMDVWNLFSRQKKKNLHFYSSSTPTRKVIVVVTAGSDSVVNLGLCLCS